MTETSPARVAARVPLRRFAARASLWLLLGGWIGAWLLFGAVVAPTAFRRLPSTELAGALVGPIIAALHLYGAAAGVALALLARALGRGALLQALPLAMSAVCLYSHFGVSAGIAEIRDLAFGAGAEGEAAAARFHELHQRSLRLFVGVGLAAVGLALAHAWADTREVRPERSRTPRRPAADPEARGNPTNFS